MSFAIRLAVLCLFALGCAVVVVAQASNRSDGAGPAFDAVSIRRNTSGSLNSSVSERPDGGLTVINVPVGTLIARAYPPAIPIDMVGLPPWAMSERYDVRTTSSLRGATLEQRQAMLRAMLAERFRLTVRVESRPQRGYELVFARGDGRLGPGIVRSSTDCAAQVAAAAEARKSGVPAPRVDMKGPVPPCIVRVTDEGLEGDTTLAGLAILLRRNPCINETDGPQSTRRVRLDSTRLASSPT
jgi:uncharacterized protein (TIGR03435 family)